MRKSLGVLVTAISIIVILSLVLSGCGTSTTTQTSTATQTATATQTQTSTATKTTTATQTQSSTATQTTTKTTTQTTNLQPINIGVIMDFSGGMGGLSAFEYPAIEMVINATNAAGGLLGGRKLNIIKKDDASDPSIVGQKADELKAAGVAGIVGASIDADNEALSVWAKTNRLPTFHGTSADLTMRTTNYSGYGFFPTPTGFSYAHVLVDWIATQNDIKTVYAIATDMGANHAVLDEFWPYLQKVKPSVQKVGEIYTSMTEQDFSSAISSALLKKPDLLLDLCAGPSGAAFIKQATQFNVLATTKMAGPYLLGADVAFALGRDYPQGIVAIDNCPYWLGAADGLPDMPAFLSEFVKVTNGVYPGSLSIAFYLSALMLVDGIKAANSTDPDDIVKALEGYTIPASPVGPFTIAAYDHQGETPMWLCTSGFSDKFTQAIGVTNIKYQQGMFPTKDEILALRAK